MPVLTLKASTEKDPERVALARAIGERLILIREILGREAGLKKITQDKLAELAKISASNIRAYETAVAVPDALFLLKLYQGTGFTPTWVISGAEPMRQRPSEPADTTPAPEMVRLISARECLDRAQAPLTQSRREAARIAAQILTEYADS